MLRTNAPRPTPAVLRRVTQDVYRLERQRKGSIFAGLRRLLRLKRSR